MFKIVILVALSVAVLLVGATGIPRNENPEILRSNMVVEVTPIDGEWVRVWCWSGTHDKDRDSGVTTTPVTLAWDFTSGISTKFWCEGSRGNGQRLPQFPVFGDGVPKKSSTWKVDGSGKIRLREDSSTVNDFAGPWF